MNYKIVKKEEFRIVGMKRHYEGPNDDESVVPVFWNEIYENGVFDKLMKLSTCEPKGVHGFLNVLGEEKVDYTIGCVSDKETLEGMTSDIIPASTWAIFEVIGPVSTAMADVWKRIFTEWFQPQIINTQKLPKLNVFHPREIKEQMILSLRYGYQLLKKSRVNVDFRGI